MANVTPSPFPLLKKNGGLYRELEVIDRLQQSLPNGYEIFHNVPLHILSSNEDQFTELDVLVMAPAGQILLIEVKAGTLELRDGGIFKLYGNKTRDVSRQCQFQYGALRARLKEVGLETYVNTCLVTPDCILIHEQPLSIPKDRIIDASRYDQLGNHVKILLSTGNGCDDVSALKRFLNNEFQVSITTSVLKSQLQTTTRQLADGLATWVPRISSPSGIYRIQATAGSGKTQLALALLNMASAKSESAAYICYNRPLADCLRLIAPAKVIVSNFHELCVEHYRRHHGAPDFTQQNFFDTTATTYVKDSIDFTQRFDLLIIDEAQDFECDWLESLALQLKKHGKLYILQDDDQRIYDREEFDVQHVVEIECQDNFRSPKTICDVINALSLTSKTVKSKSPFKGDLPAFHEYEDDRQLIEKTICAVNDLLSRGFTLSDIVILTARGRSRSQLLNQLTIGKHRIKQFSGNYTSDGDPIWTEGELLVESLYRYKGQSAPAIILSEIDFIELTEKEKRKLFVGMTRAQMALEIVISKEASRIIGESIN